MQTKGIFITFEGGEGCGKSTQAGLLAEHFRASGRAVRMVREPGGTDFGEDVRRILKTAAYGERLTPAAELLLFTASRAQLVAEVIRPALDSGEIVLCDRFTDSTLAYQGAGRDLPEETIAALNHFATAGIRPDLTILLDLPAGDGLERARLRAAARAANPAASAATGATTENPRAAAVRDRMEAQPPEFYERVGSAYRRLAAREPERFLVVDAARDAAAIAGEIQSVARLRLAGKL